ncbi:hypothetical protein Tco_0108350 [Tanacetum coccineum]
MIPPVFSSFYNNPYLKDIQVFYAKELPISSPDPITLPAILTPSQYYYHHYYLIPDISLFLKNYYHLRSKSIRHLLPQLRYLIHLGIKLVIWYHHPSQFILLPYLKYFKYENEMYLNYLDELSLHRIERMEEGRINGNKLKTELKRIRTQIIRLQKKRLGQKDKITFAHYRISDLEQIIEKIQARHQINQEDL